MVRIIKKDGLYFPQYKEGRKWSYYVNEGIEMGWYDEYKAHLFLQRKGLAEEHLFLDR